MKKTFTAYIRAAVHTVASVTRAMAKCWILAQTSFTVIFRKGQGQPALGGYAEQYLEGLKEFSCHQVYEPVQEKLSEQCYECNCLSSFTVDEVYQFQLKFARNACICLLNSMFFQKQEETSHARRKGGKHQ